MTVTFLENEGCDIASGRNWFQHGVVRTLAKLIKAFLIYYKIPIEFRLSINFRSRVSFDSSSIIHSNCGSGYDSVILTSNTCQRTWPLEAHIASRGMHLLKSLTNYSDRWHRHVVWQYSLILRGWPGVADSPLGSFHYIGSPHDIGTALSWIFYMGD